MNSHDWGHAAIAALIMAALVILYDHWHNSSSEPGKWSHRVFGQSLDWRRD